MTVCRDGGRHLGSSADGSGDSRAPVGARLETDGVGLEGRGARAILRRMRSGAAAQIATGRLTGAEAGAVLASVRFLGCAAAQLSLGVRLRCATGMAGK